ncbi:MAG: NTP transferase domain-containing protein [Saprospiraceae bacterium]|nr:NTP transferase domain-containing protein [Saprospiraceae bacterium]
MAGRGTRLRPHTLTVPKPLIPVAGKPIIQRLVEDLAASYSGEIEEIAYIVGDFGPEVEKELIRIADALGARGKLYHQEKALGVGHAIACASDSLNGKCMIAFADTLFKADFSFDNREDGVIWTQKVDDPSAFGVVKLNGSGIITEFVEKPKDFVSDQAIVGIYYFREAEKLRDALQHIIEENIREKNEFQITTALELLKNQGVQFKTAAVDEWLDCGNKENILHSNARMLEFHKDEPLVAPNARLVNTVIIPPCFIGENAAIQNSVLGPYVSVGSNSSVESAVISNSIIQNGSTIKNAVLESSMVGNSSRYVGTKYELDLGDFSNFSKR